MKLLIAGLFAFTGVAFAASIAPVSYDDGTLVSLSVPASATSCAESGCDDAQTLYMVKAEGVLYVLSPSSSGTIAQRAAFGWSKAFGKTSSLYHQQPGTPLQLRDDGRHIFVKVHNRESMYTALESR